MSSNEETKYCSNCKREIAVGNFVMHEVHCRRNIVLCEHCEEPVPRSELSEHFEEYHVKVKCEKCGEGIEKSVLQDHMETECPKRPEHCPYCELDFPHCDIEAHVDYCGSRTEPCPLCQQYIMQKDLTQHEASVCKYPGPKPASNNNERSRNEETNTRTSHDPPYLHNNFALGEIDRLTGLVRGGASRPPRGKGPKNISHRNVGVKKNNDNPRREAPVASGSTNSDTTRADAAMAAHLNSSPSLETDELLAAHFAQDLNSGPDFDLPVLNTNPAEYFDSDGLTLPCEFCNEPFPSEDLIQHQTLCRPEVNYYEAVDSSGSSILNNARLTEPYNDPTEPDIVDNLSHLSMQDSPVINSDDTMLPCEFCNELFPLENLVQHQAVCDANQTQTPRVQSPNVVKYGGRHRGTIPPASTTARLSKRSDPSPSSVLGPRTNRTTNYRVPGRNPTPSRTGASGVNKWINSDHVRPTKNTNVSRSKRTVPNGAGRYGVNMDPSQKQDNNGTLSMNGGETSNINKTQHTETNRLTQMALGHNMSERTPVQPRLRPLRQPAVPRAAGASGGRPAGAARKTRSVPQASVGADLDDTASGASGLRLDGGSLRNGTTSKRTNTKGSNSRNFQDQ